MAKAKFANMSSLFTRHSTENRIETNMDDIVKEGTLDKMENNKTKYFVLRRESNKECPASLEYYESMNKFKDGNPPRKKYLLKDYYISRKANEKKQYVFALFNNNKKCKSLIANSEDDLQDWLNKLNALKRDAACVNSGNNEYKRIWPVDIMNRGLASSQKLYGECLVFLGNWSLWLGNKKREIPLNSIKSYGRMNEFVLLEVGRLANHASGKLWMKTEDSYIAQNMVEIIKDAIDSYGKLPHVRDGQDHDLNYQRTRVSSLSSCSQASGITSRTGSRACSESHTSLVPRPPMGVFCSSTPYDPLHSRSRDYPGLARLITSSEEDNVGRNPAEDEYVQMGAKDSNSPSSEIIGSPNSELLPLGSSPNAYLEMGIASSTSLTRNASTPIPISKQSESQQHEVSPQSGNSSATTSSDQIQDLEGRSGSESIVGSCFGASELLDRPIRTSSVGSRTEQYNRKNSAPVLAWSPASHSWSGTSGTYFRNLPGIFPRQENNTMMIDYSNPNIAQEEKKGIWSSFSSHRFRSNSKSSSRGSTVKIFDSKEDTIPVDIPGKKRSDDYCEISYQGSGNQEFKGYLPMNPPKSRTGNSLERKMRQERAYLEMSPSAETSSDGYVDMSQSGSSLSITETPITPPVAFNPAHRGSSSQDQLPQEKVSKKNSKKAYKSKSMKEGSKDSPDVVTAKSKGTFSAITRIIRKTSISKSPVNMHPLKPSPPSPISSMPRNISKDRLDENDKSGLHAALPHGIGFTKCNEKQEEKMLFVPRDDSMSSQLRNISEMCISDGSTKSESRARHSLTDTPDCANRNYANLSLNVSSPQISQYGRQTSFPEVSPRPPPNVEPKLSSSVAPKNDGYLLMSSTITSPRNADRHSNTTVLQADLIHTHGDRSRSLSGPMPVDASAAKDKKIPSERTTSASSSPTSRSPPETPGLGSVSSISSLHEGGLSSASSTCTVVNVDTVRSKSPLGGIPQPSCTTAPPDIDKSRPASLNINYASLDLTKTPEGSPRPSRSSRDASKDSNYCEIDFVKSEGLRNTSLARNSSCQ